MDTLATMLAYLEATLVLADQAQEHLVGAHLGEPIRILLEKLMRDPPSDTMSS